LSQFHEIALHASSSTNKGATANSVIEHVVRKAIISGRNVSFVARVQVNVRADRISSSALITSAAPAAFQHSPSVTDTTTVETRPMNRTAVSRFFYTCRNQ